MTTAKTKEEIDQLNLTFCYEVGTLISQGLIYLRRGAELADDIKDYPHGDRAAMYPAADALFDSLMNRLRALDSFFRNVMRYDTDGVANDFVSWDDGGFLDPAVRQQINVRISHITTLRPVEHHWDVGVIIRMALEKIAEFMNAAGVDGRPGWKERRTEVEQTLRNWGDFDEVCTDNDRHAHR